MVAQTKQAHAMFDACKETICILYSIVFGTGKACILLEIWSILSAFGTFIALVVIAQFFASRLWARISRPKPAFTDLHDRAVDHPIMDDPNYKNSAIRLTKR
jgi:hypothetical protein